MRVRLLVLATALGACLALTASGMATPSATKGTAAAAKTAVTIPAAPRNPTGWDAPAGADWPVTGGNYQNQRYSSLNQITTGNVAQLKQAWHTTLNSSNATCGNAHATTCYRGEDSPIVYGGIMYVVTGNDDVYALDATNGNVIWQHFSSMSPGLTNICCGWDARGLAIGDGKVYVAQLDGKLIALDQQTGGLLWSATNGRFQDGYTMTMSPSYYNGLVYVGVSGSEQGARGSETAYSSVDGHRVWRFYNVPTPGDIGSGTWPNNSEWQTGGGTLWNNPAIDPTGNVMTYTTANADPWSSRGPGDDLFTASMVGLDPMTGDYKWHFQIVHHDIWDYDCPSPTLMFNQVIGGTMTPVVAESCKTGWIYEINRMNGNPATQIDEKAVPQNGFNNTSPTQPIPAGDPLMDQCAHQTNFPATASDGKPYVIGCIWTPYDDTQFVAVAPFASGGTVQSTSAYNPNTGLMYSFDINGFGAIKAIPNASSLYRNGRSFTGIQGSAAAPGAVTTAQWSAVNMSTNKIAWKQSFSPSTGQTNATGSAQPGAMTTASNLLFTGIPEGVSWGVAAYDASSGAQLWTAATDTGVESPPITYSVNGKQYVAVFAGGRNSNTAPLTHGFSVYAWALP